MHIIFFLKSSNEKEEIETNLKIKKLNNIINQIFKGNDILLETLLHLGTQ